MASIVDIATLRDCKGPHPAHETGPQLHRLPGRNVRDVRDLGGHQIARIGSIGFEDVSQEGLANPQPRLALRRGRHGMRANGMGTRRAADPTHAGEWRDLERRSSHTTALHLRSFTYAASFAAIWLAHSG